MPVHLTESACVGAWSCVEVCPVSVFEKNPTGKGPVLMPNIDSCIECGACVEACEAKALNL